MPDLPRRSLLRKYTLYLGGLVSALLIASGAIGGWFAYREAVVALGGVQRARADFAAIEIANFMRQLQQALQTIVKKIDTLGGAESETLRLELIALLRYHPEVSALRWSGGEGPGLALSRYALDAAPPERGAAEQARRDHDTQGNHVGQVYFRQQTEPYVGVAAVAPASGSVLQAEVNLRYVWDVLLQAQRSADGTTYVVDRRGQLIAHPDVGVLLAKTDMSGLPQVQRALARGAAAAAGGAAHDLNGQPVVATAAALEGLGWTVFSEQSLQQAFRPVYASVARSVALVLVGVAAAVAASALLARRMVRPIREIENRARQLGAGRFEPLAEDRGGDELHSLATQFNRMAARLQETLAMQEARIAERTRDLSTANEAKTRFLAAASHDLRQPIHALALFVGELRLTALGGDAAAVAARIEASVQALQTLLEALLDLSRLDVGAVQAVPAEFALQDLLARLAAQFAPEAAARGLTLVQVRTSVWVRSDPLLLERILLNLISNALHCTERGRVVVGCRRRRGGEIDVVVADSGIGIAAEQLPRVFDEFYRAAPPDNTRHPGLGLGLSIVRRLAQLLGHAVRIESAAGRGTVVSVRLPQVAAKAPAPAPAPLPPAGLSTRLQGRRVLVIDDEHGARDAMRGLLQRWGCEVASAADGEEALARARAQAPEVVLCDLRLARGERGVDVARRLAQACGPGLAVLFVTGESGAPELLAEARAGGGIVLLKPTSPGKLRAALERVLG